MTGFSGRVKPDGLRWSSRGPAHHDVEGLSVAVAGEIRNLGDLRTELRLQPTVTDEAVLARAHETWGSDLVVRLRGRFTLLAWDADRSEGFVAVDQLGAGSLFFTSAYGELVFATELQELLATLTSTPPPDELAVAQWIADGSLARGRTLYSEISRLTGGSLIRVEGTRWSIERYWSPHYKEPVSGTRNELASELRRQVTAAVQRAVPSGGRVGTSLSGGLDSSVVAAAAVSCGNSAAYSMTFPDHPSVDETPFIEAVTKHLGIRSRRVDLRPSSLLDPSLDFLRRWAWPSISPGLFQNLEVARLARDDGVAVLFDGEGGDELFAAPPYLIADALGKGRVPTAIHLARQLAGLGDEPPPVVVRWLLREYGLKGLTPGRMHRGVRRFRGVRAYALPWLNERTRSLLEPMESSWNWKARRSGPRWWAQRVQLLTSWRESIGAHDYLRRKAAMAGVHDVHPFLDDLELIEFVLHLPPDLAFDAQFTRPLLRQAMEGVLPDEVRLRTHKATFNNFIDDCLAGPDWARLVALIGAGDAEINSFVRPEVVRRMFLDVSSDRRPDWTGVVWRLATIESWLQLQERSSDAFSSDEAVQLSS